MRKATRREEKNKKHRGARDSAEIPSDIFGLVSVGMIMLSAVASTQVVIQTPKEGEISPYRIQAVIGQAPANHAGPSRY